jgi:riboflavin kinase / FMN adenylyltransferase
VTMTGAVVVIGNFDGVHRGHQAVLAQARRIADAAGRSVVVLTFDPHPTVVVGRTPPPRLVTLERRVELLRRHGADDVIVEPFTKELASWSPERFVRELLCSRLAARAVVVGDNFRFGKARAGDFGTLRALGAELGFDAVAAEVAGDGEGPFSSTRARDAIARGDLAGAGAVLGRRHALSGTVESGDRLGRTLGFPTANLGGVTELLPPHGVYAIVVDELASGSVSAPSALGKGVMNVGVRPTVDGSSLRVEAHLFDFERELYGARLRVHLVAHIRGEKKMAGLDALRAQIGQDAAAAREAVSTLAADGATFG